MCLSIIHLFIFVSHLASCAIYDFEGDFEPFNIITNQNVKILSKTPKPIDIKKVIEKQDEYGNTFHSYSYDGHYSTPKAQSPPSNLDSKGNGAGSTDNCCKMYTEGFIDTFINFLEERSDAYKVLKPLEKNKEIICNGFLHLCDNGTYSLKRKDVEKVCVDIRKLDSMYLGTIYIDGNCEIERCDLAAFYNSGSSERVPIELNLKCWKRDSGSEFICVNQLHDKSQCWKYKHSVSQNNMNKNEITSNFSDQGPKDQSFEVGGKYGNNESAELNQGLNKNQSQPTKPINCSNGPNSNNKGDNFKTSYIEWLVTSSDSYPISLRNPIPTPPRATPFPALPSNLIKTPSSSSKNSFAEEEKKEIQCKIENGKENKKNSIIIEKECTKQIKTGSLNPNVNKVENSADRNKKITSKTAGYGEEDPNTNASNCGTIQDNSTNSVVTAVRRENTAPGTFIEKYASFIPLIITKRTTGSAVQRDFHTPSTQRNNIVSKLC
jgi:hypothetical protein